MAARPNIFQRGPSFGRLSCFQPIVRFRWDEQLESEYNPGVEDTRFHAPSQGQGVSHGELLAELSREIVGLYKECYGRGPTKARTVIEDSIVVCVLEGGFHRSEQTLRDMGKTDEVVSARTAFQEALRHQFVESVERLTGRGVRAFMSGVDVDRETCSEVFVLEPDDPDLGDEREAMHAKSQQARRRAREIREETRESRRRLYGDDPAVPLGSPLKASTRLSRRDRQVSRTLLLTVRTVPVTGR